MQSTTQKSLIYGIQIAILYGIVWFIDLLDASILNVALPSIAQSFAVDATHAEWTIIGFLLALTVAIPVSGWLGEAFGTKKIFLWSQVVYTLSSLACGLAPTLSSLICFRIAQGAAGGLLIPVGMTLLMRNVPADRWATIASNMNMVTLIAPALGPLLAGYITGFLGWRWLFFIKLPLSVACLGLTALWLKEEKTSSPGRFDWPGFMSSGLSLATFFMALSAIGKNYISTSQVILLMIFALACGVLFVRIESRAKHPMIPLSIFHFRLFSIGNLIQCAANMIFLGAAFITGLFLQEGLKLDIVTTGWVLAAITPGMMVVLPLVSRYYNRIGPLPFMVPGLLLMSATMIAFIFVTPSTSPFLLAFIIFCEGAASAIIQTPNVMAIFCEIPSELKGVGSSLYALGKQLSASIGVALTTMIVTIGMTWHNIPNLTVATTYELLPLFRVVFAFLAVVPLLALLLCLRLDNKKALACVSKMPHRESETELGVE